MIEEYQQLWSSVTNRAQLKHLKTQYLLASAFTLSISPSKVTSLSIKLEIKREGKKKCHFS